MDQTRNVEKVTVPEPVSVLTATKVIPLTKLRVAAANVNQMMIALKNSHVFETNALTLVLVHAVHMLFAKSRNTFRYALVLPDTQETRFSCAGRNLLHSLQELTLVFPHLVDQILNVETLIIKAFAHVCQITLEAHLVVDLNAL